MQRARAELLASGLTQQETQAELVQRFQPLDGTKAKAWETPDTWQQGRLFKRKEDEQDVLKKIAYDEDDDEGLPEPENRLLWALCHRDERRALASARRRARALKLEQERRQSKRVAGHRSSTSGGQQKIAGSTQGAKDRVVI